MVEERENLEKIKEEEDQKKEKLVRKLVVEEKEKGHVVLKNAARKRRHEEKNNFKDINLSYFYLISVFSQKRTSISCITLCERMGKYYG